MFNKDIYNKILITLLVTIILFYSIIVFLIPNIVNSNSFNNWICSNFSEKYNSQLKLDSLNLKISPTLLLTLNISNINISNLKGVNGFKSDSININSDLKQFKLNSIKINTIYVNKDILSKTFTPKEKKKKKCNKSFNLNNLPELSIQNLLIEGKENVKFSVSSENIQIKNNKNQKDIYLKIKLSLDRLIHDVVIGENGSLCIIDNKLYANNYSISIAPKSEFLLDGNIIENGALHDFSFTGDKIPVSDTMKMLLFLQKYTDPAKKFIENFKDFDGNALIKIVYKNKNLNGYIKLTNLSAKTVLFNMPIIFKKAEFFLKNNEITSYAEGTLAGEKISHKLLIKELTNKEKKEVFGEVRSTLTEKCTNKYFPQNIRIKKNLNVAINYYIKNKCPKVHYVIDIPVGANIKVNDFYFGDLDKRRQLKAETSKKDSEFFLNYYKYLIQDNDVITGDGYFLNKNGKMIPQYINVKTNGYANNSLIGSFAHYVQGGKFKGELKYDCLKEQITGTFEVIDTIFNDFHVKSALVQANTKNVFITANGKYKSEDFKCKLSAINNFTKKIYVKQMDLFLDKYTVIRSKKQTTNNSILNGPNEEFSSSVREINMDIDSWNIKTNTLVVRGLPITNIELCGSIKDAIWKYSIKNLHIASGDIVANGVYDFNKNISILDFIAKNIDSNVIATKMFDLPNQIQGLASATLHSETKNDLQDWNARATFEIENGSLPQLENFDFYIGNKNNQEKKKLADIIKVKSKKSGVLQSHMKCDFKCDDFKIYDIDIRFQHEFLSFFVNGVYDYIVHNADVNMFGKYDVDVTKNTKVLNIPLNWILNLILASESSEEKFSTELNKIPNIATTPKKTNYFRINVKGNPNSKNKKFTIRKIKVKTNK